MVSSNFVVVSGCSGGGKSSLLDALAARGFAVVEEPGRRIVAEEVQGDGRALPWVDAEAFARRAIAMAAADRIGAAAHSGWVFFDRGLIDAVSALEAQGVKAPIDLGAREHRYHRTVFLTPPWREIYIADEARRHGYDAAVAEYERLERAYPALGYEVVVLPRTSIAARADLVLETLAVRSVS